MIKHNQGQDSAESGRNGQIHQKLREQENGGVIDFSQCDNPGNSANIE